MNTLIKAGIFVLVLAGVAEWATYRDDRSAFVEATVRGQALFRTKGCITCHTYSGIEGASGWDQSIGPDLSNYRNDPAFLRRWLAQPSRVRADAKMPDLALAAPEIEALVAFLNDSSD